MKILLKGSFIIFLAMELIIYSTITSRDVVFMLLICASIIFRDKYINTIYTIGIEFLIIIMAGVFNSYFFVLLAMLIYDLVYKKHFVVAGLTVGIGLWGIAYSQYLVFILLIFLCSIFAYISQDLEMKENAFQRSFDQERRMRYELEGVRTRLIASSNEMIHLAEIKERNRIAREVHDNIGHNIAGLLMQLQVVDKLHEKDPSKSREELKKSIKGLTDTLLLLRETVHNIKPKENLGIDYIHSILTGFCYCPVKLSTVGDVSQLSPSHLSIISANIKEALTNVAKHSEASKVDIEIATNEKFTRLYIKDNGRGCRKIDDNLGLSSMRDRIKNVGGSISISSENGFLIVCIIPVERGGGLLEDTNCR